MSFNSEEYSFNNMTIVMGGRPVAGCLGLKYKISRKTTHIYAKGRTPHARTKGNKVYTGTLTLLRSELIAFEKSLGNGKDCTDATFDIIAAYGEVGSLITTDMLKDVDITECERGLMEGDEFEKIELPIMIGTLLVNQ